MQNKKAELKNKNFFSENNAYKSIQGDLATYKLISLTAKRETERSKRLLDIGNGGVFIYPTSHIPDVHACDIFVEKDFEQRYPNVRWHCMSALDLKFEKPFDSIIAINTLHHVNGDSVSGCYKNLNSIMAEVYKSLEMGGKFICLESTVPFWFLVPYKIFYKILIKIWPLQHPPTFQFHHTEVLKAADNVGLKLKEFCWIPKISDVLLLGLRVKPWFSPIKMGKFIFTKD